MSELFVQTTARGGRTIITGSRFTSPLKIAKPFYREDGFTEIMVLVAGPGMLRGDKYDIRYELQNDTKTLISAQSYQKLFNSQGGGTVQDVQISVGENAALCYLPSPAIPFAKNSFRSRIDVELGAGAKFFFADILACGRQGMGERHSFTEFSSRVCVQAAGKTVFLDHTRLVPGEADFEKLGFFENHACQGLIYAYGCGDLALPECSGIEAAVSKARDGFTVRALGNSAGGIHEFTKNLWQNYNITQK